MAFFLAFKKNLLKVKKCQKGGKNELGGYTEKEDKFIQAIAELRRRESDERKQINIDTKN